MFFVRTFFNLRLFILLLLMKFSHVETLVDIPWNWPNFRSKLLFDSVESKPVIVSDQVDGNTKVAKPSTSPNPVEIRFCHFREIEVDDNVDSLNVNAPSEQVTTDEIAAESSSEVMEDPIAVSLSHLSVDVITGITQFSDLLSKQLDSLCGVAENDALVDL